MTQRRHRRLPRLTLLGWVLCAIVGVALVNVWDGDGAPSARPGGPDPTAVSPTPGPPRDTEPPREESRDAGLVPVTLDIPDIEVSTALVSLGLEPDRTVEVPSDADLAGWYQRGPEPGRSGSSVILGHVDSAEGPAVFARLEELKPGDLMTVGRADGSAVSFVVIRSVVYANADFPAARVYAAQGMRRLNLVTCDGAYEPAQGGYQANLVVYTRRSEPTRR